MQGNKRPFCRLSTIHVFVTFTYGLIFRIAYFFLCGQIHVTQHLQGMNAPDFNKLLSAFLQYILMFPNSPDSIAYYMYRWYKNTANI